MTLPNQRGDREYQKFVETDAGAVAVRIQDAAGNALDTGNSSTEELPTNSQFIGTWLDVSGYSAAQISLKTQNKGTLYLEWCVTEPIATETLSEFDAEFSEQIDNPGKHEFLVRRNHRAQYFRVRYLNNGFAQTSMVLTTLQGKFNAPHDNVGLKSVFNGDPVATSFRDGAITLQTSDKDVLNLLMGITDQLSIQNELLKAILE